MSLDLKLLNKDLCTSEECVCCAWPVVGDKGALLLLSDGVFLVLKKIFMRLLYYCEVAGTISTRFLFQP